MEISLSCSPSVCTVYVHKGRSGIWFLATKSIRKPKCTAWSCCLKQTMVMSKACSSAIHTRTLSKHLEELELMVLRVFWSEHLTLNWNPTELRWMAARSLLKTFKSGLVLKSVDYVGSAIGRTLVPVSRHKGQPSVSLSHLLFSIWQRRTLICVDHPRLFPCW